ADGSPGGDPECPQLSLSVRPIILGERNMDTDDISEMAYQTLRISESINHIITVEIGAMSNRYKDEDAYLKAILRHIRCIKRFPNNYIEEWSLEGEITSEELCEGIYKIEKHILITLSTPVNMRGTTQ
ncbi:MAG: hypothetical protein AAB332_03435, partial [Planctomycetota bacterium]